METIGDEEYESDYLQREEVTSTTENDMSNEKTKEYDDVEIRVGAHLSVGNLTSAINETLVKNEAESLDQETKENNRKPKNHFPETLDNSHTFDHFQCVLGRGIS